MVISPLWGKKKKIIVWYLRVSVHIFYCYFERGMKKAVLCQIKKKIKPKQKKVICSQLLRTMISEYILQHNSVL